jgi:undecaprenyl-diphosphatase
LDTFLFYINHLVERPRPSYVVALSRYLHLPTGTGGEFGFVSSHAANAFALTVLTGLVSRSRRLWIALLIWAVITSYSRIYVGVHYPFDVICGGALGALIAWIIYGIMRWSDRKWFRKRMHHAGRWRSKETKPIVLALVFITATLLIAAFIVGKYYTHIPLNG